MGPSPPYRQNSDNADKNFGKWSRPKPPKDLDPATTSLALMQIDVDQYTARQPESRPDLLPVQRELQNLKQEVPVIRMFGVTEGGSSALLHIHGFFPYLFCHCPEHCQNATLMQTKLTERLKALPTCRGMNVPVVAVEVVERKPLMWYSEENAKFFKVTLAQPRLVAPVRDIIEKGLELDGKRIPTKPYATYESNIAFPLRYMVDADISGGSWVELPAGKWRLRPMAEREGACQIEADVRYDNVTSHPPEGKWFKFAPLRILSFDIECIKLEGQGFPSAEEDPVIQVACAAIDLGEKEPFSKVVFALGECADIPAAEVYWFAEERDLLERLGEYIRELDPDILTGYNIINFDLPYLLTRAEILKLDKFAHLGRLSCVKSKIRDTVFSSRATGTRESKDINTEGRVQFDVMVAIQREYKLRSYSLNSVSAHFLNEQKEDVHYSMIGDLQRGNAETRQRIATYCLKDALLPIRLLNKLLFLYNFVEMARVTGTPLSYLLTRGQQIKVVSQLYRKCRQTDFLFPNAKQEASEEKYEGATVLEPIKGFYSKPIATLDFASLYPSIMMAHNLCYCTIVHPDAVRSVQPEDMVRTPIGAHFMKSHKREGLLPMVLDELLQARKRAKKAMAEASDDFTKMVLNGRQLALKISANSVYGFTGATVGQLACLEISSSVTAFGRQMIEKTKSEVESRYTVSNGYAYDATVVYGDTDSVMVDFGTDDLPTAMSLGKEAADSISKVFEKPIKLEFEKVYCPYLLMNKKRYAGLFWTRPEKHDKMDCKGIETVRRDNCELVQKLVDDVLNAILIDRSVDKALGIARRTISDLLQNKIDMSLLVISKSLGKSANAEDYKAKVAHVELAERMRQRDPATAPAVGDRVAFVYIKGTKDAKAYDKAEDPLYVLENNLAIDAQHYLEHQLKQPLMRLFEPILDRPETLFTGDHTRTVSVPTASGGAMAKFLKQSLRCLGCKAVIKNGALCEHCQKSKETEVVLQRVDTIRQKEKEFAQLWAECQRCQGSIHQDVICTSRDCPIFYKRTKVKTEIQQVTDAVRRLNVGSAIQW